MLFFIYVYITGCTARVSSHAPRRCVDKVSCGEKVTGLSESHWTGSSESQVLCLAIGSETCTQSVPLCLRSPCLCVCLFVFNLVLTDISTCLAVQRKTMFFCAEHYYSLEPEGNNNFFVKNERIGWGGGLGRAEVAGDIKVRDASEGSLHDTHSPGLCVSQICF